MSAVALPRANGRERERRNMIRGRRAEEEEGKRNRKEKSKGGEKVGSYMVHA